MCDSFCENYDLTRRAFLAAGAGLAAAAAGCSGIGRDYAKDEQAGAVKKGKKMDNLKLVTYCGLYCGLCSNRARIPRQANALRETMTKEGYDKWATGIAGFNEFWKFLTERCDPDKCCPGCRQGGGPPFCGIRKCAQKRKIDICSLCDEYPCKRVLGLAKGYPTLIADGKRMKEIGVDKWISEQEDRARTGFAYVDIRCYPYSVTNE